MEVISDDQDFLHYETDAVYAELVDLLDDIAAPGWIRQNLEVNEAQIQCRSILKSYR